MRFLIEISENGFTKMSPLSRNGDIVPDRLNHCLARSVPYFNIVLLLLPSESGNSLLILLFDLQSILDLIQVPERKNLLPVEGYGIAGTVRQSEDSSVFERYFSAPV